MNYPTTNSSGISSFAPGVGRFLLFPACMMGHLSLFCTLLKLIPTYIPGLGVYFDWCITLASCPGERDYGL